MMSSITPSLFKDVALINKAMERVEPREAYRNTIVIGAAVATVKAAVDRFDVDSNGQLSLEELAQLKAFWARCGDMGKRLSNAVDQFVPFQTETR